MDTSSLSWVWLYQLQVATITTLPLFISVYGGEFFNTSPNSDSPKHPSIFLRFLFSVIYLSVYISIVFIVCVFLVLIVRLHLHCTKHPENRFFRGYERLGKTVGSGLMFFGNIGMFYYTAKSIELMLLFFSLAYLSLCILALVKPYTDFGIFDFLLSASLNQALSLFGLRHVYPWMVLCACIFIAWVRYKVEPTEQLTSQHSGHARVLYLQEALGAEGDALC